MQFIVYLEIQKLTNWSLAQLLSQQVGRVVISFASLLLKCCFLIIFDNYLLIKCDVQGLLIFDMRLA